MVAHRIGRGRTFPIGALLAGASFWVIVSARRAAVGRFLQGIKKFDIRNSQIRDPLIPKCALLQKLLLAL
jgi:hypothetical protein